MDRPCQIPSSIIEILAILGIILGLQMYTAYTTSICKYVWFAQVAAKYLVHFSFIFVFRFNFII